MISIWKEPWFQWAVVLAVVYPLCSIILGEIIHRIPRKHLQFSKPLSHIRNFVVPTAVLWLFTSMVLELPHESIWVRLSSTTFYMVALIGSLSLANAVFFHSATAESWRSRVPALFLELSRFVLVLVGVSVVLSTVWGADLGNLLTALGVGSIVIGLALQETLGNVFAGIAILFEQPFNEGDWIEFEGHTGRVESITWRTTRLKTHLKDTVIIPNGQIANSVVVNDDGHDLPHYETFEIGFSYDDPPNKVKSVLLGTVIETGLVLDTPPPQVYTVSYDDSSIGYQLRFAVTDLGTIPKVRDEVATRLWYAARRHGLSIPFPIRTLHHFNGPELESQNIAPLRAASKKIVASLLPIETGDETIEELAGIREFGIGEVIISPGETVNHLNVIVSGRVQSEIAFGAKSMLVRQLATGQIFNPAELLRQTVSDMTVTAIEDTVVVQLPRPYVMDLVSTKPNFARKMEDIIELQLEAVLQSRQLLENRQTIDTNL